MTEPSPSPLRVLVVDDSAAICALVARVLKEAGMTIVGVLTSLAVLQATALIAEPDVVVLDLAMECSAFPELAKLKRAKPTCAVVVYSGFEEPAIMRAAMSVGADRFVGKSEDFDALVAAVTDAGRAARAHHPPAQL